MPGPRDYNYFRDYEPGTGRYVESDPIGLRGGPNTYAYAWASPLRRFDPKGLESPSITRLYQPPVDHRPRKCRTVVSCSYLWANLSGTPGDGRGSQDSDNGLPELGCSIARCCKPEEDCASGNPPPPPINPNDPDEISFPIIGLGKYAGLAGSIGAEDETCVSLGIGIGPPINWTNDH